MVSSFAKALSLLIPLCACGCLKEPQHQLFLINETGDAVTYQIDDRKPQNAAGSSAGRSARIPVGSHTLRTTRRGQPLEEARFEIAAHESGKSDFYIYAVQGAQPLAIVDASSYYVGAGLSEAVMDKDFKVVLRCAGESFCKARLDFGELVLYGHAAPRSLAPSQHLYKLVPLKTATEDDGSVLRRAVALLRRDGFL